LGGGLTGIYATSLTPDALLEAYRARRVFATNGSRIVMEARANGTLMGREIVAQRRVRLTLHVEGTQPVRRATLIRNGDNLKVFTFSGDATVQTLQFDDEPGVPGNYWYYWRVEQEGESRHFGGNVAQAAGNLAWSTPNWIRFE
jgi:hypothetical protein